MNIELKPFTGPMYHLFFQGYVADTLMEPLPYVYNWEQVERSYHYNYGGRDHYAHYGIFMDGVPVGCLQLKRINPETRCCEVGLILQHDGYKNHGIGTEAIRQSLAIAREQYGMEMMLGDTAGRNTRMIRVFEKLGFEMVERVPEAFQETDGRTDDRLVYRKRL